MQESPVLPESLEDTVADQSYVPGTESWQYLKSRREVYCQRESVKLPPDV